MQELTWNCHILCIIPVQKPKLWSKSSSSLYFTGKNEILNLSSNWQIIQDAKFTKSNPEITKHSLTSKHRNPNHPSLSFSSLYHKTDHQTTSWTKLWSSVSSQAKWTRQPSLGNTQITKLTVKSTYDLKKHKLILSTTKFTCEHWHAKKLQWSNAATPCSPN